MAVFRVEKNSGYTVMSNHHLRNRALSLKAKGLLSQMLSLPEDWDYTLQGLARINRESIDAIRQAIRELEQAGYIQRSRERDEKGRLRGADYVIFELPQPVPASVSPTLENPTLENPTQENFDNIDPIAIREALAERGIVGGRIVDAEANRNSPFVRQVMADVEQIAAQERKAQQEEPALDPAERFHVVSLDRGFRTLYAVWDDETHGYYDELKGVLSPEEYAAARASTLNAHYTSPTVIRAIYDAVENMGFQTGNILEPSMGVGNFFGMLPESMKSSRSIAGTFSTSRPIPSHTRTRSDWRMTVRTGRFSRMCMSRSLSEPSLNRCSKSAAR